MARFRLHANVRTVKILVDLAIFIGFVAQLLVIFHLLTKIESLESLNEDFRSLNREIIDVCRRKNR